MLMPYGVSAATRPPHRSLTRGSAVRSVLGGRALVDGRQIAVTMHDLPLAVLPSIDVGDADRHRLDAPVLRVVVEALEPHGVAHVTVGIGDRKSTRLNSSH